MRRGLIKKRPIMEAHELDTLAPLTKEPLGMLPDPSLVSWRVFCQNYPEQASTSIPCDPHQVIVRCPRKSAQRQGINPPWRPNFPVPSCVTRRYSGRENNRQKRPRVPIGRHLAAVQFSCDRLATALGIAVSGALLFVTVVFYRQASELYLVCQISFPLLALGFLLLHFMENHTLPVVVFMAGHNYFYSLLWVLCTAKARLHPNGQAIPIFASGLLAFLGSSLAGALLAAALGKIGTELGQEISVVTLVVLYLFILALAYLLGNSKRMAEEELSRRAQAFKLATHQIACEAGLSPREEEVFHLVALGKDRTEICEILGIATNTLKAHTRNVYVKLGIHSKKDAANMVEKRMSQE